MALGLVVVACICVLVAFAVALPADNLVEDEAALDFPGGETAARADYAYFALSVMTTFGMTDVTVLSREMRRAVAANATIAFVFNTVIVAGMVAGWTAGRAPERRLSIRSRYGRIPVQPPGSSPHRRWSSGSGPTGASPPTPTSS
jgi:hypothetical protein